jgi:hypothetical protein
LLATHKNWFEEISNNLVGQYQTNIADELIPNSR